MLLKAAVVLDISVIFILIMALLANLAMGAGGEPIITKLVIALVIAAAVLAVLIILIKKKKTADSGRK